MSISGIYCMYLPSNDGRYYVGQSIDMRLRQKRHFNDLSRGNHPNKLLQEAYSPDLQFEILELVSNRGYLDTREIYWIEMLEANTIGYNSTPGGYSGGWGQHNANSLYTNEVYISIATEIASGRSYADTAKLLNISDRVVSSIGTGAAHRWLAEAVPEIYNKLLGLINNRPNVTHKNYYDTTGNDIHIDIFDTLVNTDERIVDIAKHFNVLVGVVEKIAYGQQCLYLKELFPDKYAIMLNKSGTRRVKGARLKPYPLILSPEGVEYSITNAREFARTHGLQQSNLTSVLNGKNKTHKGWKLKL